MADIQRANRQHNLGVEPTRGEHERLPESFSKIVSGLESIAAVDAGADIEAMALKIRAENRLANRGRRPRPRHKHKTTNPLKIRRKLRRAQLALARRMAEEMGPAVRTRQALASATSDLQ